MVRSSARAPASAAARATSDSDPAEDRPAAAAASRSTVTMVPSTGSLNAWSTSVTAVRSARRYVEASTTVKVAASPTARSTCDRITPELPRAPWTAPWPNATAISRAPALPPPSEIHASSPSARSTAALIV